MSVRHYTLSYSKRGSSKARQTWAAVSTVRNTCFTHRVYLVPCTQHIDIFAKNVSLNPISLDMSLRHCTRDTHGAAALMPNNLGTFPDQVLQTLGAVFDYPLPTHTPPPSTRRLRQRNRGVTGTRRDSPRP